MIRNTSIVIAAVVGTSILGAAAMQAGPQQDRPGQTRPADSATFEGKIVDLHHYMTLEGSPDMGDPAVAGENFGGPVGLLVEEERMIAGTRTVLYVMLAAPEGASGERIGNPNPASAKDVKKLKEAQKLTGQTVRISGKEVERNGVKAIVIHSLDGGGRAVDRDRDRDRDFDR